MEWKKREIAKLTFSQFFLEIGIAASFLVEIKAIADENSGDADSYAYCGFGHHGTIVYKFQYYDKIHKFFLTPTAIMEKVYSLYRTRASDSLFTDFNSDF